MFFLGSPVRIERRIDTDESDGFDTELFDLGCMPVELISVNGANGRTVDLKTPGADGRVAFDDFAQVCRNVDPRWDLRGVRAEESP